jgi:hypothetical protein
MLNSDQVQLLMIKKCLILNIFIINLTNLRSLYSIKSVEQTF